MRRPERWVRLKGVPFDSTEEDGANGTFSLRHCGVILLAVVSDGRDWKESGLPGEPWEHLSLSVRGPKWQIVERTPTWGEMELAKRDWWESGDTVIQLHVPVSEHISMHDYVLHLWRPPYPLPLPPPITVGWNRE